MRRVSWSEFKTFVDSRNIPIHESMIGADYLLEAHDGPIGRECKLGVGSSEATDYETNYQAAANESLTDSNGVILARAKLTQTGWHYQMYGIEFETAKLGSVVNLGVDGSSLGHATIKFYDSNETELTTQLSIDIGCVKTVIDWTPPWDYELIGGQFRQLSVPSSDLYLHVIGAPDVSEELGGSIPFINGVNLRYVGNEDSVSANGRAGKKLVYDENNHTNRLRIIIEHGILMSHKMHIMFEIFRA